MTDVAAIIARLAQIDAERDALRDEDKRLSAELGRWGEHRARVAMLKAGFDPGQSVIVERRVIRGTEYTYSMGVLLKIEATWVSGYTRDWTLHVHYRTLMKNGRLGRKLDYRSFCLSDPAWLPDHFRAVGRTDRKKALDHPRIIRMSDARRVAEAGDGAA